MTNPLIPKANGYPTLPEPPNAPYLLDVPDQRPAQDEEEGEENVWELASKPAID